MKAIKAGRLACLLAFKLFSLPSIALARANLTG
jgi:hypothetical protein